MEELPYRAMDFWWNVGLTVVLVVLSIYNWINSNKRISTESIAILENRVITLEVLQNKAPNHKDFQVLHKRITEVGTELAGTSGKVDSTAKTVDLIYSYLLNNKD